MSKFRKKPVVIEAVQFTGENFKAILDFIGSHGAMINGTLSIATMEGELHASPHDWIIKGVKGEFYPINNAIFLETYDAVDA